MTRKRIKNLLINFIFFLSLLIIFIAVYIRKDFGDASFEQLLYSLKTAEGTSFSAIEEGITFVVLGLIICFVVIMLFKYFISKLKYCCVLAIKIGKKAINVSVFPLKKSTFTICLFVFSLVFACYYLKVFEYLQLQVNESTIFEDYYVDARDVDIEFPNEKKNLIYIVVESLESTLLSKENGGAFEESHIPNLEQLALDNISFSNTDKLGGFYTQTGNSWTAGALISHTSGVPLKISIDGNSYSGYGESLPGLYTIGEVLADNGYNNYFLLGSDATFGGRRDYFSFHGDYNILDYKWAIEEGNILEDYYVWWGYEDLKLYEYAKEQLLSISKNDENFNFTMLTADTHFTDGYVGDNCPKKFDSQYANAFYCADLMLVDFINWIKEQDFYKDTVIVITGDHLTMQHSFYDGVAEMDTRVVYNTFINTGNEDINNKNRIFSTMDMYPTTLAALGATIEGNRLGLGTNLFSDKKTLMEEMGSELFSEELDKRSSFYNNEILQDSYYQMLEETEKES